METSLFLIGWKLALVFIALSPLTILTFNIMMKVCNPQKSSETNRSAFYTSAR